MHTPISYVNAQQERLPMTLPKIVELVTKKEIPALQRYLIFEVCMDVSDTAFVFQRDRILPVVGSGSASVRNCAGDSKAR